MGISAPIQSAQAAEADLAFGIVRSDSNKNNALDATGSAGAKDLGVPGVNVTLKCVTPLSASAPGWTTQTAADGSWAFPATLNTAGQCQPDSQLTVSIDTTGVSGNVYAVHLAASVDNKFAADGGSNQIAITDPFEASAAPVELNGLIWPTWKFDLAIPADPTGFEGRSVYTGSAPFDASDTQPGTDSGPANKIVRAGDTVGYNWSMTASAEQALADSTSAVIFEQVINLGAGASASFARIPARCTPGGGGGTVPASSIIAMPSWTVLEGSTKPPAGTTSVVLSCNLGEIGIDTAAILLPTMVWVGSTSPNGTNYSTTSRVYAVDPGGVATGQPSAGVTNGPIDITAAPRFDIQKSPVYYSPWETRTINGVPTVGRALNYTIQISTDRKLGSEAFVQPITVQDRFWATNPDNAGAVVNDLKFYIVGCGPSNAFASLGTVVNGRKTIGPDPATGVSESGSCVASRPPGDDTAQYTLTFNGIDLSGGHYPTKTLSGGDLTNGPYYVASHFVTVFVPVSEIDRSDGIEGNSIGQLNMSNQVGNFDPTSLSGTSNYGDLYEPGYCPKDAGPAECELMPGNKRSNNVTGPYSVVISPGSFSKYFLDHRKAWDIAGTVIPGVAGYHDGSGAIQPGEVHQSRVTFASGGGESTGFGACDIFDNTTLKLAPLAKMTGLTNPGAFEPDRYFYVHNSGLGAVEAAQREWTDKFRIEYGRFDLGTDTANNGTYDPVTGRYGGTWTAPAAARCTDDGPVDGWKASIAAAGGIDKINAVRIIAEDGLVIDSGLTMYSVLAFEQRDTFNGGPKTGQMIPEGTVAANYGQATTDAFYPDWTMPRKYYPQPEAGPDDGDRWTVARATGNLLKRSIVVDGLGKGDADFGKTGVGFAGREVIWEITSSVSAISANPSPVKNLKITDTLPKYVKYNDAMTGQITGGTPATTVTENADGTTTLVWELGNWTPNTAIPSRIIYTDTDTLAPPNTGLVNSATLSADSLVQVKAMTDTHQVVLEQTGEMQLKKEVDYALDYENGDQQYVLSLKNFSDSLAVQAPTVIEVLPFNGDAVGGGVAARNPASKFTGSNGLQGPVTSFDFSGTTVVEGTTYYTAAEPSTISQNIDEDNPAIWYTQA